MGATSRGIATVAGVITTIALARTLEPDGWASYFVAQSLIAILIACTTLGVEYGVAYYVSSDRWGARAALISALAVAVCMGALGAAAGLLARLLFPSAFAGLSIELTIAVVVGLPFALAWLYASQIAVAVDQYEFSMFLPASQAILVLAFAVPASLLFGLQGGIVGATLGTVTVGVASVAWAFRRLPLSRQSEPSQLRRAVSFGIKGYAANSLQLINYRLDLFVLSAVASAAAVGSYSLAVAITSLMSLLPGALSSVVFPRVARLSEDADASTREMVETKSVRHASLATMVSAAVIAVGLVFLVVPIFGSAFEASIHLGLILLPGAAAIGISTVIAATVVGRGKPSYGLYGALIVTPVTIVMYLTLIPWLDQDGAAIASSLSYIGTFCVWSVLYRRTTGRRVLPLLVPTHSELEDLRSLRRLIRKTESPRA
jgi:O-antigen/teichoic acid export membrane protein